MTTVPETVPETTLETTSDVVLHPLEKKKILRNYHKTLQNFILTTRFNNSTWEENRRFIEKNEKASCIYCSPAPLCAKVPLDVKVFVLEMNNDINKIMGIGLVNNHPKIQKYNVYTNGNYNRYCFIGKHRIDRSEMDEDEETIMKKLDILCFTGNKHMKRGQGLKLFSLEFIFDFSSSQFDLVGFVKEMFRKRIIEK